MRNFITTILAFLIILLSMALSFGFWFLIFWFFTGSNDSLNWSPFNKIIYIILSLLMLGQLLGIHNKN
jgi:hypothetical protein